MTRDGLLTVSTRLPDLPPMPHGLNPIARSLPRPMELNTGSSSQAGNSDDVLVEWNPGTDMQLDVMMPAEPSHFEARRHL